jgi:hypothetical protein
MEGKDHSEYLVVDVRIILKWIREIVSESADLFHLSQGTDL